MNATTAALDGGAGEGDMPGIPMTAAGLRRRPEAIVGVALWVFIGVATTLFSLFIAAYIMRMANADAAAIVMPQQLWISTACLVIGGMLMQRGAAAAAARQADGMRRLVWAGGGFAVAFLVVQWWAWQVLLAQQVSAVGNPAGSFFYLLTALHGLHVVGGLAGWAIAARAARQERDPAAAAWRIALCARYWHFLLLAWVALFASFTLITPEVARVICRTA
jgi:cytochrome c oxidase subunit III